MINISNYTGEGNPLWRTEPTRPSGPGTPSEASRAAAPTGVLGEALAAVGRVLAAVSRELLSWMNGLPRCLGDRLFAMNDTEAYWRDWQIITVHGGLGRQYRDPRFDTLAECPKCRGAGIIATLPCPPCAGAGRIIRGEVS